MQIVTQHDLVIMSDEVYEHIVFQGRPHLEHAAPYPDLASAVLRGVKSFGKTYHATGWRTGLLRQRTPAHDGRVPAHPSVHQLQRQCAHAVHGIADFMRDCIRSIHREFERLLREAKRDRFCQMLSKTREFKAHVPARRYLFPAGGLPSGISDMRRTLNSCAG